MSMIFLSFDNFVCLGHIENDVFFLICVTLLCIQIEAPESERYRGIKMTLDDCILQENINILAIENMIDEGYCVRCNVEEINDDFYSLKATNVTGKFDEYLLPTSDEILLSSDAKTNDESKSQDELNDDVQTQIAKENIA